MVNPVELFELRDIKDYDTAVKYTGKHFDMTCFTKTCDNSYLRYK